MRIDGKHKSLLGFDNMEDRAIKGSTGWTEYKVVLDVPEESVEIAFGFLLAGSGQVWATDLHIDPVDVSTPSTARDPTSTLEQPVNLTFKDDIG
jgi:hypothetical protein